MATLGSSGQDAGTTATTTGTASSSNNPPVDNAVANICNNNSILSGGIGTLSLFHPNQYAAMSFLGSNGNFAATVGANANINNANANNHSASAFGFQSNAANYYGFNNNNGNNANSLCVVSQRRNTIYAAQRGLEASELLGGRQRHQVMNIQIFCHPITVDIPENPQSQKLVNKYNQKLGERMDGVIGKTLVALDPREQTCRFKEGILTGFVCDVIVHELRKLKYSADFALLGGAAFSGKAIIPAGDLKVGDIFSCFPNDTRIMCLRMPGDTVIRTLNAMVREMPAEAPSFPHCSGDLKFTINLFKSPPDGRGRVCAG